MEKGWREFFRIEHQETTKTKLIFYILLAYGFNIAIKMLLYYQILDNPQYFVNGSVIPIWNYDSGLYGYYANRLIDGANYPLIAEYMPGYLLYWLHGFTGITVDNLLFFSPIFLSSLIVIPSVLIANTYGFAYIGFYAAMIGGITTSYYYRTHLGYYDTDILNVVIPLLSIYFIIKTIESKKCIFALWAFFALTLFTSWYHVALPINLAIILTFLAYILIFDRKDSRLYQAFLIIALSILPFAVMYKFFAAIILYILFKVLNSYITVDYKYYLVGLLLSILIVGFRVDSSKYTQRAMDYADKQETIDVKGTQGVVKFKADLKSVQEAQQLDVFGFMHRVSGVPLFFILAFIGYLIFIIRYKSFILTLPLVIFMFASIFAGLRFSIYGVMIFALSLVFMLFVIRNIFIKYVEYSPKISDAIIYLFIFFIFVYHVNNVARYSKISLRPSFFETSENIVQIKQFSTLVNKNSFMINWWDYSWPLWYYTGVHTLIDNGKHQQDNFIVSKILLSDNQNFVRNASIFFSEKFYEGRKKGYPNVMDYFVAAYGMEQLNQFNESDIALPKRKRDLYIFLHTDMYIKLPIIESMSNINYYSGEELKSNVFARDIVIQKDQATKQLITRNGYIDVTKGVLKYQNQIYSIGSLGIKREGKLIFKKQYDDNESSMQIVIEDDLILYLNKRMLNSFLIQVLFFNNYDKEKFESVAVDKNFMILKVK
ncbi:MAG: hypothetical protein JXQ76_11820 [Campylobacterales bacterium]|nr:hypothetical protein [Campylobacterales bacterium]